MASPKYYPIIDNGGIAFVVKVLENEATIFDVGVESEPGKISFSNHVKESEKADEVYERESRIDGKQKLHLYHPWIINAKRIFVPKGEYNSYDADRKPIIEIDNEWEGNSILIETAEKEYIYVGPRIFSFHAKDPIQEYRSIVGNNAVPYPQAISAEETYLLEEYTVVLLSAVQDKDDPYYEEYEDDDVSRGLEVTRLRAMAF